jgi:hypothetical protein
MGAALCLSAVAQYSIDWFKIAGGGCAGTNGTYSVSGTISQPDASSGSSGGIYSVTGGFWGLISVVQAPGAPRLFITYSGNTVTVFWQALAGWSLQQNSSLVGPAGWSASTGVTTSNGTNYWSVTNPTDNLFLQLKSP